MPWEKQYDETEVLERAMRAFWARGYAATSMSDLVAATGINRGSIYAAFSDKRTLFLRALEHYDRRHRADFLAAVGERAEGRAAILATFECAAAAVTADDRPGGCLLVNTALELSPHDPEIAVRVRACLAAVEAFFREQIEAARAAGEHAGGADTRRTAQALLALFIGLRVLTRSTPDPGMLDAIVSQARTMLE